MSVIITIYSVEFAGSAEIEGNTQQSDSNANESSHVTSQSIILSPCLATVLVLLAPTNLCMSDDSGNDSNNDSSNDTSSSDSGRDALAANKNQHGENERYQATNSAQKSGNSETSNRENAGIKDTSRSDWETDKKSADKKPSGDNEVPSADEVSIPSSVDPDAPSNSSGDQSDTSSRSESRK